MSLAISLTGRDWHIIGIDRAVSTSVEGKNYRVASMSAQKYVIAGNKLYFVCGDFELGNRVKRLIQESNDHRTDNIINLVKTEWSKNKDEYIAIGIYGFDKRGTTKLTFFGSGNNFTPLTAHGKEVIGRVAYGFKQQEAMPLVRQVNQENAEIEIVKIFEALSCEEVGGEVDIIYLTPNGVISSQTYQLKENLEKMRVKDYKLHCYFENTGYDSFPVMEWGVGSGNGDAEMTKMYKKDQDFVIEYTTSESIGKRKKLFKIGDEKILISSAMNSGALSLIEIADDGTIRLQHHSGSVLEIGQNITIKAAGNIKLEGQRIDLN